MESARDIEGLDEEIAMLRVKLLSSLGAEKFDMNQMLRGMELLIRAVSARYKVSGKNEDDLYASAVGVLKGMGELLTPPVDEHG